MPVLAIQLTNSTAQLEAYLGDWQRRQGRMLLQQRQQQQQRHREHHHGDISKPPPPPTALALALRQARALSLTSLKTAHVGVWSALAALHSCVGDISAMTGAMQR